MIATNSSVARYMSIHLWQIISTSNRSNNVFFVKKTSELETLNVKCLFIKKLTLYYLERL